MKKSTRFLAALMLLPASLFAATIGGTVTTGATGGTGGTPIAAAKVVLIAGGGGGGGTRLDSTATDAEGKYSFTLDTTGSRQVQVTATGYNTGTGNVNASSDTGNYTVNVNLLSSAPGRLEGKVSSDTTAGTPIVGALVIVRRNSGGTFTPESTLTDSEGKYAFAAVSGNTGYTVAVSAAGFANVTRNNVAITAGQTSTQNFLLVPPPAPGSISGKVVKASDSSALAGARVILSRSGGGGGGFTPDTVLTNAQGAFAFDTVPVNTNYSLTVSLTGYETEVEGGINVVTGQAATEIIALAPPIPPGSVAGKITKASDGSAISGARVILSRTGGGGGGGFAPDTVLANASGEYAFDSVANQNNFVLTVSAAGFSTTASNNLSVSGGLKTTVNFTLDALAEGDTTGTVKGIVRKGSDDSPIPGATVILSRLTGGGGGGGATAIDTVTADSKGAFSFPDLVAGNYRLSITATGFQPSQSGTLALAAGGTFLTTSELTTALSIMASGRVHAIGKQYWNGGRLIVELDASKRARSLAVFDSNGKLKHRLSVATGTSRVTLPADVKPGSGALVRVEY